MGKTIKQTKLSATLTLSECTDGFWLYDETRGMNLAMYTKSERAAFVNALSYYQDRLKTIEEAYKSLNEKVDAFVAHFVEEE